MIDTATETILTLAEAAEVATSATAGPEDPRLDPLSVDRLGLPRSHPRIDPDRRPRARLVRRYNGSSSACRPDVRPEKLRPD